MIRSLFIAAALIAIAGTPVRAADDLAAAKEREFTEHIQPLLKKFCIDCHGGKKTEAELSLAAFKHALELQKKPTVWRKVMDQVADHNMPPKEAPQPSAEQRQQLTKWIEGMLKFTDCGKPVIPYATIRRLTRTEYRNTVRDLLGVDYKPADDFPADDVGYGFDGIGDVLTLPPILLEKYFAAGEAISQQAIKLPPPDVNMKKRSYAGSLKVAGPDSSLEGSIRWLKSEGEVYDDFEFPADGNYRFKAKAFAEQAGSETAKMSLLLGGRTLKTFEVKAEAAKPESYYFEAKVTKGKHTSGLAFVNDYYNPEAKGKDRDRNLAILYLEVSGPTNPQPFEPSKAQKKIVSVQPGDGRSKLDAAREVLRPMISRAYRRRASEEDLNKVLGLANLAYENNEPFEAGLQLAFQALLASPQFIYKVEQNDGADSSGIRTLNEYELATRLSYFLWASMPDDELFRLASTNQLRQGNTLEQQVRRLLADPRAKSLSENFAAQWLQLRMLDHVTPDRKQFPQFDDSLRSAMRRETEMFFESVVKEDRSVVDLLAADYTFANERLAAHYGLPNVKGDEFQRVSLAGTPRGGLLTQASVLYGHIEPESRTSPVKRGRWVLDNLLADPPPPPAPDVPPLPDDEKAELKGTLRQRTEKHRSDPRCASCHVRMDPLGFALENFDAVGRWREKDGGETIDAHGELPGGVKFNGPQELRQLLLRERHTDFVRCVTEKLLTYGLGRGLELGDRCAVDKVLAGSLPENYKFSRLVLEIVRSDPFQKRAVK